ncbi:extracellular solute-binding protein [Shimia sp. R10_1]|uniref:ABC transporter substrate-binding protein n=1 Tax=Shimia sp. R10_1 TaxID=2821095 RepID=UPI001ADB4E8E|nr:extracellular solute-binding protein [Shimia sp. R10_1]MBO9475310.1 extracellular solute-binding protein [Shimia sp. R10_1]
MKYTLIGCMLAATASMAQATETLNILTWEGYVGDHEIAAVNALLQENGYDVDVRLVDSWAEGPQQMFDMLRTGDVDISFLTLNYINMEGNPSANMLQPINVNSPRLENYKHLSPALTDIPMGMKGDQHLYIPWGGGAYGLWANLDTVEEMPASVSDLLKPEWKGRVSLTEGQVHPNIALASMANGHAPFEVNDASKDRAALGKLVAADGALQDTVNTLYSQVGHFWTTSPPFTGEYDLVASYGVGASAAIAAGGNWGLVAFEEGNTVWLDTINFAKHLEGKKLEAAEIFANYFIGKDVQTRVVEELGMVAATSLVERNPLIDENPAFFEESMFWPPYTRAAGNAIELMSKRAMGAGATN